MTEINNCENCHHYNSLIHWDEGLFHQCMMGNKLWEKCNDYDAIKELERMTEKRFTTDNGSHEDVCLVDNLTKKEYESNFEDIVSLMNDIWNQTQRFEKHNQRLEKENEQLKNKIDVLEDDNETYHKSLEKLNLYTKRFIPTKCTNEFKDCKTNRYYWLDHEGNFEGCLELLNLLDCENEVLTSENRQLKAKLMVYEEQIKGD